VSDVFVSFAGVRLDGEKCESNEPVPTGPRTQHTLIVGRRRVLAAALLAIASGYAHAQVAWPSGRPVRMIVPFSAGGATDVAARVVGQALGEWLKTNVVVDNKPGAHGFVGVAEAARAAPDGYTLLMASIGTMAINPKLHEKIPYDPNKDFAPISLVAVTPVAVVINPRRLPVTSVTELVAYLKAHPGKVNFASAGTGGTSQLVPEYFKFRTGTLMTHIPYKGESAAIADVVAGQVDLMFSTVVNAMPHIKSGRLRLLAVTSAERAAEYPLVPTMAEALKMPDFEALSWVALYAPAATAPDVINRLSSAVAAVLKDPKVAARLTELGALPSSGSPAKLAQFQRAEQEKWGKVIEAANIKAD
jgi:tripartite-type tricarboxylate transporter receptor subunit TctC